MFTKNVFQIAAAIVSLVFIGTAAAGRAQSNGATVNEVDCPGFSGAKKRSINDGLTCYDVKGFSAGNHEIDCTLIVPD